ncbi:alpha-ribazole phosphatase [Tellurirhabdus bombi]|uniref:alpha-ribazole phosphatase n=1 Tax=Tellurirhabdus bombi TaxID=2907205 RepID=UPI001F3EE2E0|nr:alpha-ribazole phosphatase [Tellurirhabdus bombi]
MEIYLIRHTAPLVTPGFIYGRTEVELRASFDEEAGIIQQKLPKNLDVVYSSPSRRCTQLAALLSTDYQIDDRLYEFHFGDWEGQTWDTIDPRESQAWMDDFVNVSTPNGENMLQMQARVMAFWQDITQTSAEKLAIVTHGGVIRLLLAADRKLPLRSAFDIQVGYGDVFLLHPRE